MAFKVFTDVRFIGKYPSDKLDITFFNTSPKLIMSKPFQFRGYQLLILNSLRKTTYIFMIFKLLGIIKAKVVVLDPIFVKPNGFIQSVISRIKGFLLNKSSALYIYAKNNTSVENYFGIKHDKFTYIPFKVNGLNLIKDKYSKRVSQGYVFSGGRSRRDYSTLINAAALLPDIPFKIVCPKDDELRQDNCLIYSGKPPPNVTIINDGGTLEEFFDVMADSELVVLPTTPESIAPAGISVYLNAMALKRPLIITEGPAVDDILTDELAVIVRASDANELSDKIKETYNDEKRKKQLAESAYKYAMSLGDEKDLFYSIEKSVIENIM